MTQVPDLCSEVAGVHRADRLAQHLGSLGAERDLRMKLAGGAEVEVGQMTTVESVSRSSAWTMTA